jgi:quercetin dioxygenase-like cupin family protein
MAIIVDRHYVRVSEMDDPDDYRLGSEIALVADPVRPGGDFVEGMCVLFENCGPGERIPLHTHPIEEVMIIEEGIAEVTLGDERRTVGAGATIFIPAGVAHGTRNTSDGVLRLHAIFPSSVIPIQYIERNPAPGTEGQPPQPLISFDARDIPER